MKQPKISVTCKNVFEGGETTTTRERFTEQYIRLLRLLAQSKGIKK